MAGTADRQALETAAAAGDPAACYALAAALSAEGRKDAAVLHLQQSAAARFPDACYTLATFHLNGQLVEKDEIRARALLESAVTQGHWLATRLKAAMLALGLGGPRDWPGAVALLCRAADAGAEPARREIALLSALYGTNPLETLPENLPLPAGARHLDRPKVRSFPGLIPPALCAHVAVMSKPVLQPARVVDPGDGSLRADPYRNSLAASLWPVDLDLVLIAVRIRMCTVAGATVDRAENLSVLVYHPGMSYRPHYDYLTADTASSGQELQRAGQRVGTVLLYLNDDYEGGETRFVEAGFSFRGRQGDALVFDNVDENGRPDRASLHEGRPVIEGNKWLASQWIRERASNA